MKYLIIVISLLILQGCQSFGEAIVAKQTQVFYKEAGLKEKAAALAAYLEVLELTDGSIPNVQLTRDTVYNVKIIIPSAIAYDYRLESNFQALGDSFVDEVFDGRQINLQLCDHGFRTLRTIPINKSRL